MLQLFLQNLRLKMQFWLVSAFWRFARYNPFWGVNFKSWREVVIPHPRVKGHNLICTALAWFDFFYSKRILLVSDSLLGISGWLFKNLLENTYIMYNSLYLQRWSQKKTFHKCWGLQEFLVCDSVVRFLRFWINRFL